MSEANDAGKLLKRVFQVCDVFFVGVDLKFLLLKELGVVGADLGVDSLNLLCEFHKFEIVRSSNYFLAPPFFALFFEVESKLQDGVDGVHAEIDGVCFGEQVERKSLGNGFDFGLLGGEPFCLCVDLFLEQGDLLSKRSQTLVDAAAQVFDFLDAFFAIGESCSVEFVQPNNNACHSVLRRTGWFYRVSMSQSASALVRRRKAVPRARWL